MKIDLSRRTFLSLIAAMAAPSAASKAKAHRPPQVGCNVYELVLGKGITDSSAANTVKLLGARGIPLIRFPAGAQWAGDWATYEATPELRWRRLDAIFEAAEIARVSLIPCLFWSSTALPFHCGESLQAWSSQHSKTNKFAKDYVQEFIYRYDRSSAMLMYEYLNEPNAWVDIPNVLNFWPRNDSTINLRNNTEEDRVSSKHLQEAISIFASYVREISRKPISSGSDLPRYNAEHLARGLWDSDTLDQNFKQLAAITPLELGAISIHIYREKLIRSPQTFISEQKILSKLSALAKASGQLSFVGEFGIMKSSNSIEDRRNFRSLLDSIVAAGVNFSATWNYSSRPFQSEWDVSFGNDRTYQLEMIAAANASS